MSRCRRRRRNETGRRRGQRRGGERGGEERRERDREHRCAPRSGPLERQVHGRGGIVRAAGMCRVIEGAVRRSERGNPRVRYAAGRRRRTHIGTANVVPLSVAQGHIYSTFSSLRNFASVVVCVAAIRTLGPRGRARTTASLVHAVPQHVLHLQPLLDLPSVDPVLPRRGPLVPFAVRVVPVRVEHLQLEVRRKYPSGSDTRFSFTFTALHSTNTAFQHRIQSVSHFTHTRPLFNDSIRKQPSKNNRNNAASLSATYVATIFVTIHRKSPLSLTKLYSHVLPSKRDMKCVYRNNLRSTATELLSLTDGAFRLGRTT